jgi:aldehyde dehydrogenase (NAD+)
MNAFQDVFDKQKAYFETSITKSYDWRIDQLDRMVRMVSDNESRLQKAIASDFKTASQEYMFETASTIAEAEFHKN